MKFWSTLNDLRVKGRKPNKQNSKIKNITNLYNARDEVIKFYKDYARMMYNARYGKGLKILTPYQMLQRIPIAFAQWKASDTSASLLNEISQIIYYFYPVKEITKKVFNSIMNPIQI